MPDIRSVTISGGVEGLLDEAVLRRLIVYVGATPDTIYGKQGKDYLHRRIQGYNEAASFHPWVILVDLNNEANCATLLKNNWIPRPSEFMCFRVAVREIESWLLADRERLAKFLSVSCDLIPLHPESINDPKQKMVEIAKQSRQRDIREDMVPREGSGRREGPAYISRLIEFIEDESNGWRPDVAAEVSDSLRRCILSMKGLIATFSGCPQEGRSYE